MHLSHDKRKTEALEEYVERCWHQVMNIVKNTYGQDNFVFFAHSTVFQSRTGKAIDIKSIQDIQQKFLERKSISTSDPIVTIGHLAVYTKEGKYISHRPQLDQSKAINVSQNEVIRLDVVKSIAEKQQASTYVMILNKACFPNVTLENVSNVIKKYGWKAQEEGQEGSEEDNCATAIHKIFTGKKIRKIMNPIETLHFIARFAINNFDLTTKEKNDMMNIMLDSGLSRNLTEIVQHEEEYKDGFIVADEEISLATKKI
jgi:hypothetical protein